MRTIGLILSSALITVSVAGAAFAQSTDPGAAPDGAQQQPHRGFGGARMIERFDRNGDGRLEVSELPPHMQERLAAADTNHDGVLSPEELHAHFEARRAEWLARVDANHDGVISPEERAAAREARINERFARMDTNGDGAVTEAEVGPERWARVSRADANGDGRVTRDELAAAHMHFHHGHRMHRFNHG
jgi:Ca2+-binding EF-hand superfamily protein